MQVFKILFSAAWWSSEGIVSNFATIGPCSKGILSFIIYYLCQTLVILILLWRIVEFACKKGLLVLLFCRLIGI